MKKRIKSIISAFVILGITFAFTSSYGVNPVVTISCSATGLIPGSTIHVPVIISGDSVGIWQLVINYDRNVLTYQNTTDYMTALSIGAFTATNSYVI